MINYAKTVVERRNTFKIALLLQGTLIGALAGSIAVIYRLLLGVTEATLFKIVNWVKISWVNIIVWFIILMIIGFVISLLIKWEPDISGSGIPQIEAEVTGQISQNWLKVIIAKIVGGALAVLGGLSLGREGPSIQLGGMVGKGVSRFFKRVKFEERYLITCGAAAGLAAAFNAPLAGMMFALEEVHKNFSASVIISVMCASITGDFVSRNVFGIKHIFDFPLSRSLPLNQYMWVIILALIVGLAGVLYNKSTKFFHQVYQKIRFIKPQYYVFIPLLFSFGLMFVLPEVLGGGHHIINILEKGKGSLSFLLLLLVVKYLFSQISFCSGTPGGIFFPLLVIGSLLGATYGRLLVNYGGLNSIFINNFIILAMVGFFSSIVRAPLTGIILVAEMSGSLKQLLPLAIISFGAYLVAEALKSEPIYEYLTDRLLLKHGIDKGSEITEKLLNEYIVQIGSQADGSLIKNLELPKNCLIVAIDRGSCEIVPRGNTKLLVGDLVTIMTNQQSLAADDNNIDKIFSFQSE